MSMIEPMIGSAIASSTLVAVSTIVTTAMPAVLIWAYCSRYTRMNVDTVVSTRFWPNPAVTSAMPWARADGAFAGGLLMVVAVIAARSS